MRKICEMLLTNDIEMNITPAYLLGLEGIVIKLRKDDYSKTWSITDHEFSMMNWDYQLESVILDTITNFISEVEELKKRSKI